MKKNSTEPCSKRVLKIMYRQNQATVYVWCCLGHMKADDGMKNIPAQQLKRSMAHVGRLTVW